MKGQLTLFNPDNWNRPVEDSFEESSEDIFSDDPPISEVALESLHKLQEEKVSPEEKKINMQHVRRIFDFKTNKFKDNKL